MRIALVQLRIDGAEAPPQRLQRVVRLVTSLRGRTDVVMLPELWLTGAFATEEALASAEPIDGPTFASLAQAARCAGVYLLGGTLAETGDAGSGVGTGAEAETASDVVGAGQWTGGAESRVGPESGASGATDATPTGVGAGVGSEVATEGPAVVQSDCVAVGGASTKPFNTAVVFGPDGSRQAVYRKIHLFGFDGGEAEAFRSGDPRPKVWDSPWGRLGLATCYDLRFPELFRALTDQGAIGFLVPTGWPQRRIARWDVLARARAIENQAWLIGVNAVGRHAGMVMGGHSIVVDPSGEVVFEASADSEEVLVVEIDPAQAEVWRQQFPALRDRRL